MDTKLLIEHINNFQHKLANHQTKLDADYKQRQEDIDFYSTFDTAKILQMTDEDVYTYMSRLWAMLIWGNKKYYIDKILADNGLAKFKKELNSLLYDNVNIEKRWDKFRKEIKGLGPAMISEILCKTFPDDFMLWNRRAYVALDYLGVSGLPRFNYQNTGAKYNELCGIMKEIASEMKKCGVKDTSLLAVDYFIWDELQFEANLSDIHKSKKTEIKTEELKDNKTSDFIHNEVRDKISDIGDWLGFNAKTEQKVAEGSRVDVYWESTIGNMGRVIYVFEVQTAGNIDSLLMNLLKTLNNPAVQGIVAVSDEPQIEKIKKQIEHIPALRDKLRYWNYKEVLEVHESLEYVNASINKLQLVPEGF